MPAGSKENMRGGDDNIAAQHELGGTDGVATAHQTGCVDVGM
jgi:hypothetical protein